MKILKTESIAYSVLKRELVEEFSYKYPNFFDREYYKPENDEFRLSEYIHYSSQHNRCNCGESGKSYRMVLRNPETGVELFRTAQICWACGRNS